VNFNFKHRAEVGEIIRWFKQKEIKERPSDQLSKFSLPTLATPSITGAISGSRLACNFGFLDTWSSLGIDGLASKTSNPHHPQQEFLTSMIKEKGVCLQVNKSSTQGRMCLPGHYD
jgi:hypothetical protein